MTMGLVYCEGGALQAALNALKSALEIAKKKKLINFVAIIQRRLAYAYVLKCFYIIFKFLDITSNRF